MITPTLYAIGLWKKFKKLVKNKSSVEEIVEEIKDEGDLYCFYSSKSILHMMPIDRELIFSKLLLNFPRAEHQWRVNYLRMAFSKQIFYYDQAIKAAEKTSAEDLIYFFEYKLQFMLKNDVAFDGKKMDAEIIESQYGHLISTFNEVIKFIEDKNIEFTGKSSISHTKESEKLILALSYFLLIKEQIKEVLNFSYDVIPSEIIPKDYFGNFHDKVKFLLSRKLSDWGNLEIYRDLNYSYLTRIEESRQEMFSIMQSSGFVRENENYNNINFDFAKVKNLDTELRFHKISKLISEIYESTERKFTFKNNEYEISKILEIAKKIYIFSKKITEDNQKKLLQKRIYRYGEKQFLRILNIDNKSKILLDLFTYNFDDKIHKKSNYLPLFLKNKIYYLSPSHIWNQSYEKVIDKILSRSDILVKLLEKEKGFSFELALQNNITNLGFEVGKIKRDEKKKTPEIDGIISLSNKEIIVYEAKCTVKPEERDDAYGFVENHLSKACDQLLIRSKFLKDFPQEAEERIKFSIAQKNITFLVVTNHSYFTGLVISEKNGITIHVIDQNLFLHILSKKTMPSWFINPISGFYSRKEIKLDGFDAMLEAIKYPVKFLKSNREGKIQISEYGAAYEISITPDIEWSSFR